MAAIGAERCTNCGAGLAANAKVCVSCGTHVGTGLNVKTIAKAKTAGKFGKGLAIAALTAITGGVIWAWIAVAAGVEIGYLAIGLGFINALVLVALAGENSFRVGVACCALAVLSLFVGKALTMHHLVDKGWRDEVLADEPLMQMALAWDLYRAGQLSPAATKLMQEHPDEADELPALVQQEAAQHFATLSQEDKEEMAQRIADQFAAVSGQGFFQRLAMVCGAYDILWAVLAIGAAWKVGTGGNSA